MWSLAGCRPDASPAAPVATSAPAAAAPAVSSAPPKDAVGVATTRPGTVAGAQTGRATPVDPSVIAALPAPTGRGAQPRGTVPTVVFHGPRDRKRIALTFDSNMTDAMLRKLAAGKTGSYANDAVVDELQQLKTPATFFLAGKWVQAYPELTRRIAADPNFEIASHSWAHEGFKSPCYTLGSIPRADMAADVERSFEILAQFTDHASRYFRFPGGCYDAAALTAIAPVGCTAVEYDDVSGDAFGSSAKTIIAKTVAQARPGSIVVLHITKANAPRTAEALPSIIRQLRARGYELVTLGDLLAPGAR
jgi:peptidoglycan/xylan/chitin deacetylase (PgdA/CDA1 family)